MADLWISFIEHIRSLPGVDPRDVAVMLSAVRGYAKDPHACGVATGEAFHRYLLDACAGACSPQTSKVIRDELRLHVSALFKPCGKNLPIPIQMELERALHSNAPKIGGEDHVIADNDEAYSQSEVSQATRESHVSDPHDGELQRSGYDGQAVVANPPTILNPMLSVVSALPPLELGIHCAISPAELAMDHEVQHLGCYLRHPSGKRNVSSETVKQLVTKQLCKKYLQWSDQRVENVHTGLGSVLATATAIVRRRIVFVVGSEHQLQPGESIPMAKASAVNAGGERISVGSQRYPIRKLWQSTQQSTVLRKHAGEGGGSTKSKSTDVINAMFEGTVPQPSTSEDHTSSKSNFVSVKITEITEYYCVGGLDVKVAMEILLIAKSAVSWSDPAGSKAPSTAAPTSPADGSVGVRHLLQLLVLVDTEGQHLSEQLMHALYHVLLPRLKILRHHASSLFNKSKPQAAPQEDGAAASPTVAGFDFSHNVVFFGKRLLPLLLPCVSGAEGEGANSKLYDPTTLCAPTTITAEDKRLKLLDRQAISASSGYLQLLLRDFADRVSLSITSSLLFPDSIRGDLQKEVAVCDLIVSFMKTSSSGMPQSSPKHVEERILFLLFNFPGGERSMDKHIMQLLFQAWCVDTLQSLRHLRRELALQGAALDLGREVLPGADPLLSTNLRQSIESTQRAIAVRDEERKVSSPQLKDPRLPLANQYIDYCVSLQSLVDRVLVLCRISDAPPSFANPHYLLRNDCPRVVGEDSVFGENDDAVRPAREVPEETIDAVLIAEPHSTASAAPPAVKPSHEDPTRNAEFSPRKLANVLYADVLHIVVRVEIQFPPVAHCSFHESRVGDILQRIKSGVTAADETSSTSPVLLAALYPSPQQTNFAALLEKIPRVVGDSTLLTICASLFASFGITAIVYEDLFSGKSTRDSRKVRVTLHQQGDGEGDAITIEPVTKACVLGFSPMIDVAGYGKEFVEECLYAAFSRQLLYIEECFWPLLVRLRVESVAAFRAASVQRATTAANEPHRKRKCSRKHVDSLREVFVVTVGEEEDAETLERADKNGELGNVLRLPVARVFLIPRPFLLAAMAAQKENSKVHPSSATDTHSDNESASGTHNSVSKMAAAAEVASEVDDAMFLAPHVYQPEDAEAIWRITKDYANKIEELRYNKIRTLKKQSRSNLSADAKEEHDARLGLLDLMSVRPVPSAVLRSHHGGGDHLGPLLPCVELTLEYSSGPYLKPDDSVCCQEGAGLLPKILSLATLDALTEIVMQAAEETMTDSVDVAKVKEEALIHAIHQAEMLLRPNNSTAETNVVVNDSDESSEEEDEELDEGEDANRGDDNTSQDRSNFHRRTDEHAPPSWWSSWMWWGGGAEGEDASLQFDLNSTKLAKKRSH